MAFVGAGDEAGRSGWRGGDRTVEQEPGDSGGVLAVDFAGQAGAVADAAQDDLVDAEGVAEFDEVGGALDGVVAVEVDAVGLETLTAGRCQLVMVGDAVFVWCGGGDRRVELGAGELWFAASGAALVDDDDGAAVAGVEFDGAGDPTGRGREPGPAGEVNPRGRRSVGYVVVDHRHPQPDRAGIGDVAPLGDFEPVAVRRIHRCDIAGPVDQPPCRHANVSTDVGVDAGVVDTSVGSGTVADVVGATGRDVA